MKNLLERVEKLLTRIGLLMEAVQLGIRAICDYLCLFLRQVFGYRQPFIVRGAYSDFVGQTVVAIAKRNLELRSELIRLPFANTS